MPDNHRCQLRSFTVCLALVLCAGIGAGTDDGGAVATGESTFPWDDSYIPGKVIEFKETEVFFGENGTTTLNISVNNNGFGSWDLNVSIWAHQFTELDHDSTIEYTEPAETRSVVTGDITGDGDMEIVFGGWDGDIHVLEDNGGSWDQTQVGSLTIDDAGVNRLSLVDVNGNGILDIIATGAGWDGSDAGDAEIRLFTNTESTYGDDEYQIAHISGSNEGFWGGKAADLTGDGEIEVVGMGSDDNVYLYEQDTGLDDWTEDNLYEADDTVNAMDFADFTGDGELDIVVGGNQQGFGANDVLELLSRGGGGDWQHEALIDDTNDDVMAAVAADLYQDGGLDIVAGTRWDDAGEPALIRYWDDGDGWESGDIGVEVIDTAEQLNNIQILDYDGDGRKDVIAVAGDDYGELLFYNNTNNSAAGFEKETIYTQPQDERMEALTVADVTGNGVIDIVTGDHNGDVVIHENTGMTATHLNATTVTFDEVDEEKQVSLDWETGIEEFTLVASVDMDKQTSDLYRTQDQGALHLNRITRPMEPAWLNVTAVDDQEAVYEDTTVTVEHITKDTESVTLSAGNDRFSSRETINEEHNVTVHSPVDGSFGQVQFQGLQPAADAETDLQVVEDGGDLPDGYTPGKPVYALDDTDLVYDEAELTFPDAGIDPTDVLRCNDWDRGTATCTGSWEADNLAVYDAETNDTHVWFTVDDFSAYTVGESAIAEETRHMTSVEHTVNQLTADNLSLEQSDNMEVVEENLENDQADVDWGVQVFLLHDDGSKTPVVGSPSAVVTRGDTGQSMESETVNIPETGMEAEDAVFVNVSIRFVGEPWEEAATFVTEPLNAEKLADETWTIHYHTDRDGGPQGGGFTDAWFRWGHDDYDSRIDGFTYEVAQEEDPYLDVTLDQPAAPKTVDQDDTFTVEATATCRDGDCGSVDGEARYNESGDDPDQGIDDTMGETPFYTVEDNPQLCHGSLEEDQSCTVTWTVNATGDPAAYSVDAEFTGSEVDAAATDDEQVTIEDDTGPDTVERDVNASILYTDVNAREAALFDTVVDTVGVAWTTSRGQDLGRLVAAQVEYVGSVFQKLLRDRLIDTVYAIDPVADRELNLTTAVDSGLSYTAPGIRTFTGFRAVAPVYAVNTEIAVERTVTRLVDATYLVDPAVDRVFNGGRILEQSVGVAAPGAAGLEGGRLAAATVGMDDGVIRTFDGTRTVDAVYEVADVVARVAEPVRAVDEILETDLTVHRVFDGGRTVDVAYTVDDTVAVQRVLSAAVDQGIDVVTGVDRVFDGTRTIDAVYEAGDVVVRELEGGRVVDATGSVAADVFRTFDGTRVVDSTYTYADTVSSRELLTETVSQGIAATVGVDRTFDGARALIITAGIETAVRETATVDRAVDAIAELSATVERTFDGTRLTDAVVSASDDVSRLFNGDRLTGATVAYTDEVSAVSALTTTVSQGIEAVVTVDRTFDGGRLVDAVVQVQYAVGREQVLDRVVDGVYAYQDAVASEMVGVRAVSATFEAAGEVVRVFVGERDVTGMYAYTADGVVERGVERVVDAVVSAAEGVDRVFDGVRGITATYAVDVAAVRAAGLDWVVDGAYAYSAAVGDFIDMDRVVDVSTSVDAVVDRVFVGGRVVAVMAGYEGDLAVQTGVSAVVSQGIGVSTGVDRMFVGVRGVAADYRLMVEDDLQQMVERVGDADIRYVTSVERVFDGGRTVAAGVDVTGPVRHAVDGVRTTVTTVEAVQGVDRVQVLDRVVADTYDHTASIVETTGIGRVVDAVASIDAAVDRTFIGGRVVGVTAAVDHEHSTQVGLTEVVSQGVGVSTGVDRVFVGVRDAAATVLVDADSVGMVGMERVVDATYRSVDAVNRVFVGGRIVDGVVRVDETVTRMFAGVRETGTTVVYTGEIEMRTGVSAAVSQAIDASVGVDRRFVGERLVAADVAMQDAVERFADMIRAVNTTVAATDTVHRVFTGERLVGPVYGVTGEVAVTVAADRAVAVGVSYADMVLREQVLERIVEARYSVVTGVETVKTYTRQVVEMVGTTADVSREQVLERSISAVADITAPGTAVLDAGRDTVTIVTVEQLVDRRQVVDRAVEGTYVYDAAVEMTEALTATVRSTVQAVAGVERAFTGFRAVTGDVSVDAAVDTVREQVRGAVATVSVDDGVDRVVDAGRVLDATVSVDAAVRVQEWLVRVVDTGVEYDPGTFRLFDGARVAAWDVVYTDAVAGRAVLEQTVEQGIDAAVGVARAVDYSRLSAAEVGVDAFVERSVNAVRTVVDGYGIEAVVDRVQVSDRVVTDGWAVGSLVERQVVGDRSIVGAYRVVTDVVGEQVVGRESVADVAAGAGVDRVFAGNRAVSASVLYLEEYSAGFTATVTQGIGAAVGVDRVFVGERLVSASLGVDLQETSAADVVRVVDAAVDGLAQVDRRFLGGRGVSPVYAVDDDRFRAVAASRTVAGTYSYGVFVIGPDLVRVVEQGVWVVLADDREFTGDRVVTATTEYVTDTARTLTAWVTVDRDIGVSAAIDRVFAGDRGVTGSVTVTAPIDRLIGMIRDVREPLAMDAVADRAVIVQRAVEDRYAVDPDVSAAAVLDRSVDAIVPVAGVVDRVAVVDRLHAVIHSVDVAERRTVVVDRVVDTGMALVPGEERVMDAGRSVADTVTASIVSDRAVGVDRGVTGSVVWAETVDWDDTRTRVVGLAVQYTSGVDRSVGLSRTVSEVISWVDVFDWFLDEAEVEEEEEDDDETVAPAPTPEPVEDPDLRVETEEIVVRLNPGESTNVVARFTNNGSAPGDYTVAVEMIGEFFDPVQSEHRLFPDQTASADFQVAVGEEREPDRYEGRLRVDVGDREGEVPVNVIVVDPEPVAVDLSLDLPDVIDVDERGVYGLDVFNLGQEPAPVNLTVEVLSDGMLVETVLEESTRVETSMTLRERLPDLPVGNYTLAVTGEHPAGVEQARAEFEIVRDIAPAPDPRFPWRRAIVAIGGLLAVGLLLTGVGSAVYLAYALYTQRKRERRRYMQDIDWAAMPGADEPGGSAYLGKLAAMDGIAYFGLDQLMTHALVSGATGSGKTVTAQIVVEEALEAGKNVIVLDPTAQWSGFLRPCETASMLEEYDRFDMAADDVQAYEGNIRAVDSPDQEIDITDLLQGEEDEGSIVVFSLHKLASKDIESFLASMVQQVFDANLEERDHVDTVIVFDEVHRLLDRFGGSGRGLEQLERGVREFRKWGVGMVLISQVIGDFPPEVRSNIGTKIQLRTRDRQDLQFYRTKYSLGVVRSIIKESVGSGMVQNAEYNQGKPYFVDFRPLKHAPHRLSDEDLDRYEEYNQRLDALAEQIDEAEDEGEDVFSLRSELDLARDNLKQGSFDLVDIYVDELESKLDEFDFGPGWAPDESGTDEEDDPDT